MKKKISQRGKSKMDILKMSNFGFHPPNYFVKKYNKYINCKYDIKNNKNTKEK